MRKEGIQTAVAGVSGYAGMELARLLLRHPALHGRPPVFVGRDAEPVRLTDMHPQLADNNGSAELLVEPFSWELLKKRGVELLFLATPACPIAELGAGSAGARFAGRGLEWGLAVAGGRDIAPSTAFTTKMPC